MSCYAHLENTQRFVDIFNCTVKMKVDEMHVEMASREFAEIEVIEAITDTKRAAVGIVDVKSYYIETPEDIAEHVRLCLLYAPAERLLFAPDCGLSQTARLAAKKALQHMVSEGQIVRQELGL